MMELETYVNMVSGNLQKIPATMGGFQNLFGALQRKHPHWLVPKDAPSRKDFPTQNHSDMDGKMLPPQTPTDLPWPRDTSREELDIIWDRQDCQNLTPLIHGGETKALEELERSITSKPSWVASYEKPKTSSTEIGRPSTTGMSPYLSLGCVSPRTVWCAVTQATEKAPPSCKRTKPPVSLHGQLLWREFNNLMAHTANRQTPGTWGKMKGNMYCRQIPWSKDEELIKTWQNGQTGYPWIDACMTQLRTEGWIHHLGRHAVACFLTRGDLWQSWEDGADYFESQLLDADYALNGFNWLWLSCSGFFYQYFRCYSPVAFQKKNDKSGAYIRKWLPQLSKLPDKYIYEPWKAPINVQKAAGIKIGKDYPKPIVDHTIVSKENMEKISFAYDIHKEQINSKTKKKKNTDIKGPPKKKMKKQTKLQF